MPQIVVPILTSCSLRREDGHFRGFGTRKVVIPYQRRREAPFAPGFNRNMARCDAVRVDLAPAFCT